MNVLNRAEAPEAYKIEQVKLLKPELLTLANGIPVYYINGGTEDVLRIEFQFDAGNATSQGPAGQCLQ
jgi:zinc protease